MWVADTRHKEALRHLLKVPEVASGRSALVFLLEPLCESIDIEFLVSLPVKLGMGCRTFDAVILFLVIRTQVHEACCVQVINWGQSCKEASDKPASASSSSSSSSSESSTVA